MDTPGAYETKATEAMFYVTLPEPTGNPKRLKSGWRDSTAAPSSAPPSTKFTRATTPSFFGSAPAPSKTRKVLYNNSNAEGWAHYCEQMMLDEGYGDHDPKLRMGQLVDALLRDARFIVGIEMHTGKMTLAQGSGILHQGRFSGSSGRGGRSQTRHL